MRFLIGRCLPGEFDILLGALALDLVEALLAWSHVEQPGFSKSQGRVVKMEWDPSGSEESLEAMPAFIYTTSLSCAPIPQALSELQH